MAFQFPQNEQMSMVSPGMISRSHPGRATGAGGWQYKPGMALAGTVGYSLATQAGEIGKFLELTDNGASGDSISILYGYMSRMPAEDISERSDPASYMFHDSPDEIYFEFEVYIDDVNATELKRTWFTLDTWERIDSDHISTDEKHQSVSFVNWDTFSKTKVSGYRNAAGAFTAPDWNESGSYIVPSGVTQTIRVYYKAASVAWRTGDPTPAAVGDGILQIWTAPGSISQTEFHSATALTFTRRVNITDHANGGVRQLSFRNVIAQTGTAGSTAFRELSTYCEGRTPAGNHSNSSTSYTDGSSWRERYCMWLDAFYDNGSSKLNVKATGWHDQNLHAATGAPPGANLKGQFKVYTSAALTTPIITTTLTNIVSFGGTDNADAVQVDHYLHTDEIAGLDPLTNYWIVFERAINDGTAYTIQSKPVIIKTPSVPGGTRDKIEFTPISCTHASRFPNSGVQLLGIERADAAALASPAAHRFASHSGDLGYHDDTKTVQRGTGSVQDGAQSVEEFSEVYAQMLTCHTMMRFLSTTICTFIQDDHETFDNVAMIPLEAITATTEWWQSGGLYTTTDPLSGLQGYTISPRDLLKNSLDAAANWTGRGVPTVAQAAVGSSRRFDPTVGALNWGDGVTAYAQRDGLSRSYDYAGTRVVLMEFRRFRHKVISATPTNKVMDGGNAGTIHKEFFVKSPASGVFNDNNMPENLVLICPQPLSDLQLDGTLHVNESYGGWNEVRGERNLWMNAIENNSQIQSVFSMCGDFHMMLLSDHSFHRSEDGSLSAGKKWVGELTNGGWLAGGQDADGTGWNVSKPFLETTRGWFFVPGVAADAITAATVSGGTATITIADTSDYAVPDIIDVTVVTPSEYNGHQKITALTATTISYVPLHAPAGSGTAFGECLLAVNGTLRGTSQVLLDETAKTYACEFQEAETALSTYFTKTLRPSSVDDVDLMKGLVSLYKFNDETDAITEIGNDLTINGTPTFEAGIVDGAVNMNLANKNTDSLSIANSDINGFDFQNRSFSMFMWLKWTNYEAFRFLLSRWGVDGADTNRFYLKSNTLVGGVYNHFCNMRDNRFSDGVIADVEAGIFPSNLALAPSAWNWLEFSYDSVSGYFYVGANLINGNSYRRKMSLVAPTQSKETGLNAWRTGDPNPSDFRVGHTATEAIFSQLAIYNRFLPVQGLERAKIYNSGNGLPFSQFGGGGRHHIIH